jgi:Sulfotransferase domain
MKPNYMLIGASKCASSSICTLLGQHPDVFMVKCKETAFFSNDEIYQRGFDWYESLYNEVGDKKMLGEGSNRYTMKEIFPHTVSRIVSYNPDLKLIYCVRNPITRIESFWMELRSHGGEVCHYDFNKAVRFNRDRLVDSSNYWQQLNAFRPYFPDNRIHIVFYEDFKNDPTTVMRSCFQFLDVDPDIALESPNLHIGDYSSKTVPRNILSQLREYSLFRTSKKLIPTSVRKQIKKLLLSKKVSGRPQWHPEAREWVADILEDDSHKFLEYYGKPKDYWKLRI